MDGLGKTNFTDDVGGAVGALLVQEFGGGNRGGEDVFLGDFQAILLEAMRQVPSGVERVVGED